MTNSVEKGQIYRHFKGHEYIVLHLAVDTANLTPLVVYQNIDQMVDDRIWVRRQTEFLDFHASGVKRFELIQKNDSLAK
ncbi:DUF1653 domain-containing protein [Weissella diestrammenae]|uniref:DUF1653 domain-containing protein n=1 Tax=Weissella diestrammenae TaxID=1162633 RepID=A0A7G9T5G2_9LACO|nr:DUF1653 domain-containing protein [Weissella diestrammenae]MCM0583198.1 DUF1653 domain-containing protein [Weissella diestrammenae]QNN75337.1 DUF1653 domain-containing protein [Weissella diestrammenae]